MIIYKENSYLHGCLIKKRDDDPSRALFTLTGETVMACHLNGYAIVPIEEYYRLQGQSVKPVTLAEIKKADEQIERIWQPCKEQ